MLISCKCLNFVATSGHWPMRPSTDEECKNNLAATLLQTFLKRYPRNFSYYSTCMDFFKQTIGPISDLTINALSQRDLIYSLTLDVQETAPTSPQLQPPTSSQCIQRIVEAWQLSICINCNTALCAKRILTPVYSTNGECQLQQGQQQQQPNHQQQEYLINSALLTSNEELTLRRADKSFSEAFGLLIMDYPTLKTPTTPPPASNISNFTVGSAATTTNNILLDSKQQRLRQLQQNLQQRLKREIAETDERIQRYTEQQFALLKSFREKSEQEYELLVRLIQQVPEQNNGSNNGGSSGSEWWLDRLPPALEVNGAAALNYASRRRNTITSRRDLNINSSSTTTGAGAGTVTSSSATAPTTPTSPNVTSSALTPNAIIFPTAATASSGAITTAATTISASAIIGNTHDNNGTANITTTTNVNNNASTTTAVFSSVLRKMSNFDTPPATPEATPMSVGNSPTFKQQQQQQQQSGGIAPIPPQSFGNGANAGRLLTTQMSFQQQFPTPTAEVSDDCIFELEGVESNNTAAMSSSAFMPTATMLPFHLQQQQQQQKQNQQHNAGQFRSLIHPQQQQQQHQQQHQLQRESSNHYMSDLDESDADAEEAEDALDMESSAPIAMGGYASRIRTNNNNNTTAQMLNYAKSLPIEIANSPLVERGGAAAAAGPHYNLDSDEDELDNTVDIAASIKALAKSVHGEAVFGDLPRPRLRSQI